MKYIKDEILVYVSPEEVISSYEDIRNKIYQEKNIDTKYLYLHTESAENWAKREESDKGIAGATIGSFEKLINSESFKEEVKNIQTIIDLGIGKGVKTGILLEELIESPSSQNKNINVVCFDFSLEMIKKAVKYLREKYEGKKNVAFNFIGYKGDFMKINETSFKSNERKERVLFMLLGGTLGNVDEESFIKNLSDTMQKGDLGIITFFNYQDGMEKDRNKWEQEYLSPIRNIYGPTISDLGYNLTDINIIFDKKEDKKKIKYFNIIAKVGLEDLSTGKYIDDVKILESKRYNPDYIKKLIEENGLEIICEEKDNKSITTSILFKKKRKVL